MIEMKCFGYYLVKPMPKPDWCTLKARKILTVSENNLSCKFPDLRKCFWVNYPKGDRDEYKEYLGLNNSKFSEFCQLISKMFNEKHLTADVRFSCFEDALLISTYLQKINDYKLVGLFTDIELFSEFEKEGYFKIVKAGSNSDRGKSIGFEILGSELIGENNFSFDSYIINSLNEVLEDNVDLIVDYQTGLIKNTYKETKHFSDIIQGMGEPVIWRPFELYEYDTFLK